MEPVTARPTRRVMMYRTLRGLDADGLVKRHRGGGISIL